MALVSFHLPFGCEKAGKSASAGTEKKGETRNKGKEKRERKKENETKQNNIPAPSGRCNVNSHYLVTVTSNFAVDTPSLSVNARLKPKFGGGRKEKKEGKENRNQQTYKAPLLSIETNPGKKKKKKKKGRKQAATGEAG